MRSAKEVRRHHVQGTDAVVGRVEDFIVDDETWEVRYLVVDTTDWWFDKKVLVAPQWASSVSWSERKIHLGMSRAEIKDAPEWIAGSPVNRDMKSDSMTTMGFQATGRKPRREPARARFRFIPDSSCILHSDAVGPQGQELPCCEA